MASDRYPFGAHERIDWLCDVFRDSGLQTPTVAVFAADLIKHTNSQTGEAYPSISRIAKEYGMAREAISRGVKRLLEAKKIEVVLRPGRSTIYKLLLPVTAQSQVSSEPVTVQSRPCDCTVTPPVTAQLHEPLPETGTIPVSRKDGGETSPAPGGAGSLANLGDRFPDFWQAFPVRSTVAEAEKMIVELVAAGVELREIIEGAKRYQKYNAATASKKRQSAKQWLTRQAWRDDWTLPPAKQKKTPPPRFNIDRLQDRFTEISLTTDIRSFNALHGEIYEKHINPHIWPNGKPEDDMEYEPAGRENAACPACWDRLYGFKEGTSCCSKSMDELAELIDDMDAWSESLYTKTRKEPPPL